MVKILFRKKCSKCNTNKLLEKIIINSYIFVIFIEIFNDRIMNIKKIMCLDLN